MRVAIFFDGKNFHAGWRSKADGVRVDFPDLARWIIQACGGSTLWGANYYTGVERGERADEDGQRKLTSFLNMLDLQPGYFVHRFPRKFATSVCDTCGNEARYTQEKEVDTTLVADMLRTAALGAADIFVLVSGDTDHAPAVEGVRALGKQAFVASWGGYGLSPRLRRAAFDHIDLLNGMEKFSEGVYSESQSAAPVSEHRHHADDRAADHNDHEDHEDYPSDDDTGFEVVGDGPLIDGIIDGESPVNTGPHAEIARELRRAEEWFEGGYVGLNYFLTRWKSPVLDPSPEGRRKLLHELAEEGLVDIYEVDGAMAVRSQPATEADLH